ncbi:MAG: glycosyltransferase [Opitutaceae bacterium]|nr:glycosyltransferase [Cytophagales bacterium]
MKLLFICGNLEPGKDGVGDYTLMMAKRCMQLQVKCCILAINDVYISERSTICLINEIPVLRIKSTNSRIIKKELSQDFIKSFDPEIVSIQMVGYAYQARGWIFGLGSFLKSLFKSSVKFEINLHELWLGFSLNHDWKAKCNGLIQRLALQSFLKSINPSVIHVGNDVYYSLLNTKGYSGTYLPLPSNIGVRKLASSEWINLEMDVLGKDNIWIGLFFGSIQGNWDINSLLNKLISINKKNKLYILSVGNQGFGNVIWDEMVEKFGSQIIFKKLGYKSNNEISDLLAYSDFGIGTTPLSLLGKSGTAMAMIEHGLPIIVTRDELKYGFKIEKIEDHYNSVLMWDKIQTADDIKKSIVLPERSLDIASVFLQHISSNN